MLTALALSVLTALPSPGAPAPTSSTLTDVAGKTHDLAFLAKVGTVAFVLLPKISTPEAEKVLTALTAAEPEVGIRGATVIVAVPDAKAAVTAVTEKLKFPFSVVSDPKRAVAKLLGVGAEKTAVVVTFAGKVVHSQATADDLAPVLEKLSQGAVNPTGKHSMLPLKNTQWMKASNVNAEFAVLNGNPGPGGAGKPFTMLLKVPAGVKLPAHYHPLDENNTILAGTFLMGMGAKWNDAALMELPVGGSMFLDGGAPHFALAKTESIILINGIAPFMTIMIDPKDDLRWPKAGAPPAEAHK